MLKKLVIVMAVMMIGASAYAADAVKHFEGLWMDEGGPTVIKEFPGYALYFGMDSSNTWSGTCVKNGDMYKCSGLLYDSKGNPQLERTTFKLAPEGIITEWVAITKDGEQPKMSSLLKRVK